MAEYCPTSKSGTGKGDAADGRANNNPHTTVRDAGKAAALSGEPVHACPYTHPAMRNSWLRGYIDAKQLGFDF